MDEGEKEPKFIVVRLDQPSVYGLCENPKWLGWDGMAQPLLFSREDAETFCRAYKPLGWELEIHPEPSAWLAKMMRPQ